jgi:hypothetical protein
MRTSSGTGTSVSVPFCATLWPFNVDAGLSEERVQEGFASARGGHELSEDRGRDRQPVR